MVKKIKDLIIYVIIFCMLSACSSPEADDKESIANEGIKGIAPPKGCEIINNIEEFNNIVYNQEYNKNTDANTSFYVSNGSADAGEGLYSVCSHDWLVYFDKNTGNSDLLCGKPDCEHTSQEECNAAIFGSWGIQYYDGYLYTVESDNFTLKRISLDGSEEEKLGSLISVNTISTLGSSGCTINWVIHRGYIYYCYAWNSGMTEDIYYLNNSNCIYRKSLDKNSGPECITALPVLSYLYECQFIGAGSYMYMIVPTEDETMGRLYRHNMESGKLEWFKEWGDEISGVFVNNNKIYYSENKRDEQKTKIYCYDIETKEKNIFLEINGLVGKMKHDNDFIYITYTDDKIKNTKISCNIGVWSWQGEHLADIPIYNGLNEQRKIRLWAGTDDSKIYFKCKIPIESEEENIYGLRLTFNVVMEYVYKNDILDGDYEFKEWKEIVKSS